MQRSSIKSIVRPTMGNNDAIYYIDRKWHDRRNPTPESITMSATDEMLNSLCSR